MASAAGAEDEDGITSINITPLVDVFLVLLIIVMISSSLLEHREVPVSIPKAAHAGEEAPKASGLSMNLDRQVFLDGVESDSAQVVAFLREKVSRDSTHQVLIAADQGLLYQDVVGLLDWVRGAGVHKYALKVSRKE
jgi:biopolymer transport protein ExbD